MPVNSYAMPIRAYFLVIGPALLVFLWLVSSALEPNKPAKAPTAGTAQAAKAMPAQTAARPAAATTAAPQAASLQAPPDAKSAEMLRPSVETSRPSAVAEAPAPSQLVAPKHKKRKQTVARRDRRDPYGNAYAYGPYRDPYGPRYPYAYEIGSAHP